MEIISYRRVLHHKVLQYFLVMQKYVCSLLFKELLEISDH